MKKRMVLLSLLSILIAGASWITNFGFVRLSYTIMLIPILHAVIVFAVSVLFTPYAKHIRLRLYNFLFCITYLVSNVFLPDMDEVRDYMFFGLIHNDVLCNVGEVISAIALIMHVIFFVLQVVEAIRIKKRSKFSTNT